MAQVQKWWEVSGTSGGRKQQIQPMAAGYAGKVEVLNDTTRVAILNMQGEALLEKAIAHLVSGVQTADGLDSLGNAYLWLSYTQNLGSGNMLVLEKLSSVDSIVYTPQYLHDNMASSEPIKLICSGQEAILLTAVYLPDSTSYLRWLKFDAFNGLLTDSFSTSILSNVVYSYAETFGNKAIVHGSTPQGKKNWLLDFSNASVQEWQWNFGNIALVGNETTTFTRQEDIFSVIHTYTDSTQTDALLTLCDTSFAPKWTIRYNSEYDLNDSIVDLAFYQDKIYIAGYVQKDSVNKDYLIASLNHDGTMNWELKYDGPGMASIDLGVSLCVDEVGDLFFTGHSTENGQSRVFSIQLNEYGNVLWESDFAEAIQRRATEIVTRDGRVYLTGQNLSNSVNNFVILYKDSLKIESIQKMHLKMLATGFSVIQEDSTLKSLVWDKFSRQYSFRRTVSFSSMQKFMKKKGVDFNRLMNAKINSAFKLDKRSQTVELILASLKSRKETPFIHFPFLDSLRQEEFIESRETIFAYSQSWPDSLDYELPCVFCPGPITLQSGILDLLILNLDGYIGVAGPNRGNELQALCEPRHLIRCIYEIQDGGINQCIGCFDSSDSLDIIPGHAFLYEIGVNIPDADTASATSHCFILERQLEEENEYFNNISFVSQQSIGIDLTKDVYMLETVGRNKHFKSFGNGDFEPICYGIAYANYYVDNISNNEEYFEYVSSLTLCEPSTLFNVIGEWGNKDFKLASGALFKLTSVFSDTPPIYFVQPMGASIMFVDGPDYTINILLSEGVANICSPTSNNQQIVQKTSLSRAHNILSNVPQLFNQSEDEYLRTHIVSKELSELTAFWENDNIYLALSNGVQELANPANLISIKDQLLETCVTSSNQTLLCELNCSAENKFRFFQNGLQLPVNETLRIEISASFESGLVINGCFNYVFTGTGNFLNFASVLPTGRIRDYMENSANYSIKIYSTE